MIRTLAAAVVLFLSHPVFAQDASAPEGRGIGVGVTSMTAFDPFNGAAATVEFDVGVFQIDGLVGFALVENQASTMLLGGRFYYAVHQGQSSDLSLGAGAGTLIYDPDNRDSEYGIYLEGGAKIRAFLTPNVALIFTLGLNTIFIEDTSAAGLGGKPTGSAGVLYFF